MNTWKLGMDNKGITKEQISKVSIIEIAEELEKPENGFEFRYCGMILKGLGIIYSKKAVYCLEDLNEAIMNVSILYQGNVKNSTTIETHQITEEDQLIDIWKNAASVESIIQMAPIINDESVELEIPDVIPIERNERRFEPILIDNDLGDPIEIDMPTFNHNEMFNIDNIQDNHILVNKKRKICIDPTPLIPMNEYMKDFDIKRTDSSRKKMKKFEENLFSKAKEIDMIFEQIRKDEQEPPCLPIQNQEPDIPIPIEEIEITQTLDSYDQTDSFLEMLSSIILSSPRYKVISLKSLSTSNDIRSKAVGFYASLILYSEGKIEITQESIDDIQYSVL